VLIFFFLSIISVENAVLESSVIAALGVVLSSRDAGWPHFRLEGLEVSAGDISGERVL